MSSLVKITNLERWGDDIRWRQRGWVLKKRASNGISKIVVAGVVFSNSNEHTARRQGWNSAYKGGGRGGDRFSLDRLNLGSSRLLVGSWGIGGGGMRGGGVDCGSPTVHHIALSPHDFDCGFMIVCFESLQPSFRVSPARPQTSRM